MEISIHYLISNSDVITFYFQYFSYSSPETTNISFIPNIFIVFLNLLAKRNPKRLNKFQIIGTTLTYVPITAKSFNERDANNLRINKQNEINILTYNLRTNNNYANYMKSARKR